MTKKKINYVIPEKIAKKINDKRTKEYKAYRLFLGDEKNFVKVYITIHYLSYSPSFSHITNYEYSNFFIKKYLKKYYPHIKTNQFDDIGLIIKIVEKVYQTQKINYIIPKRIGKKKNDKINYIIPKRIGKKKNDKINDKRTTKNNKYYMEMEKYFREIEDNKYYMEIENNKDLRYRIKKFFDRDNRFLINPVSLEWYNSSMGHANILFIDKIKKSIILIEPYGKLKRIDTQNQVINEIKRIFTKKILKEYKFVYPDFLESGLLQSTISKFDYQNCILHSLFIAIFFIINQDKNVSYNELINILKNKFNPKKNKLGNINLRLKKYIKKFVYLLSMLKIPYNTFRYYDKSLVVY